jgi:hypothetical protein
MFLRLFNSSVFSQFFSQRPASLNDIIVYDTELTISR